MERRAWRDPASRATSARPAPLPATPRWHRAYLAWSAPPPGEPRAAGLRPFPCGPEINKLYLQTLTELGWPRHFSSTLLQFKTDATPGYSAKFAGASKALEFISTVSPGEVHFSAFPKDC